MSTTFKRFIDGEAVGASVSTGYTARTGVTSVIHKLTFSNHSTGDVMVTVYLVPSGASLSANNTIEHERTVPTGETFDCISAIGHVLEAGGTIQYVADTPDALGVICSGVEVET